MYVYLYDAFLRERKYEGLLARLESRLLTLGINGKTEKLTILKSMRELAENALQRGAKTIVVVGDDQTASKIINVVVKEDVVLGIIPVGKQQRIARALGIPEGVAACDVLSARIIEHIDVGKANETYFLSFLDVQPSPELYLDCEKGAYALETQIVPHTLSVYNFGNAGKNPRDGILEVSVRPVHTRKHPAMPHKHEASSSTLLPIATMRVKTYPSSVPAYADGQTVVKTPIVVTACARKLKVIVGKNRTFR